MTASPDERFGVIIGREQYESDKKSRVAPEDLNREEYYNFRHLIDEKKRQLGAYAVENLVIVQGIKGEGNYYAVDFEWTENRVRQEQPNPTLLVSFDGLVFTERAVQKWLLKGRERLESGYLLNAEEDWDEALAQLIEDKLPDKAPNRRKQAR